MKQKNRSRVIACLLSGVLLLGTMSGCGSTETGKQEESKQTSAASQNASESSTEESVSEDKTPVYPLEGGTKLTMAMVENTVVSQRFENLMETPFGKAWQEATGVEIEILQVADNEAMNLIFAGGELPDLIWWNFDGYAGGASKAIKDKIIEPLNDYMEYAPDLQAVFDSKEAWSKGCKTNDGDIIGAPFLRGDDYLLTYTGMIIRQDWLDDLGLDAPQTPDELYDVLKAFKEKKGADVPFSTRTYQLQTIAVENGLFTSPFGLPKADWYQKDGVVHYGYAEKEYKDALAYLNKLYTDGLLDPNFQTNDDNTFRANIMNGNAGLVIDMVGGGMGTMLKTMEDDPSFDVAGLRSLVKNRGDIPMCTQYNNSVTGTYVVMTPTCKNKEVAAKFLNYGYTEAGHMLFNFGIEGTSYTMVDGYPTYSDYIMNNPDGLTKVEAMVEYTKAYDVGPFVQDRRYQEQYSNLPQQQAALSAWSDTDAAKYAMPSLTIPEEYLSEYSSLMGDIKTYISEMFIKYVTGLESLDTFESEYLNTLKSMGVDRAIEIKQKALDSFNAR